MKLLYFGTICNMSNYQQLMCRCKSKLTVATIVFEDALMDGFSKNGIDVQIHSFPMVPMFPNGNVLHFGGNSEVLPCGYKCHWLYTINIPIFKQWSRRMDARKVLKKWLKKNLNESIIITYSIPPFLVKDIVKFGKKYKIKTAAIVPDLPKNMYMNHKKNKVVDFIKKIYLSTSLRYQGEYDGYIYLTEMMSNVVAPNKPYIVMEGIVNLNDSYSKYEKKAKPRSIMYAGRLHKRYGLMNLIEAFEKIENTDLELWIFGEGSSVEEIQRRANCNTRIKYFGQVSRKEILKYEKMATLLVNPRNDQDEFTEYSFPSKTIEYMYSGTPLLTTKLKGIPNEYYNYIFSVENNETLTLMKAIQGILRLSDETLNEIGKKASLYIREQKNARVQSQRIIEFLSSL